MNTRSPTVNARALIDAAALAAAALVTTFACLTSAPTRADHCSGSGRGEPVSDASACLTAADTTPGVPWPPERAIARLPPAASPAGRLRTASSAERDDSSTQANGPGGSAE